MKYFTLSLIIIFLSAIGCSIGTKKQVSIHSEDSVIEIKVDSILALMTLEEKVGQMLNVGLEALLEGNFFIARDTILFDTNKVKRLIVKYGAGSVQNYASFPLPPAYWRYVINYIQKVAVEETRMGIPILYGIDAVHGANYTQGSVMTPHQINLAATFNKDHAYMMGSITAYEMKAGAQSWNFSPVLDVARHPYWGRIAESFGEDPYLVSVMGTQMLAGMQSNMPSEPTKVIACGKHFLGYGAMSYGKDRSAVLLPENYLRQYLLPPFEAAIKNGLLSVMVYSGTINGVPSHSDYWLLTTLLKDELGFKGVILSDWSDIDNLFLHHKTALNERDAVKQTVLAGLDICMDPYDESFAIHLIDLVNSGEVPMSRIDDAVRRILFLKYKSGVFENPYFDDYDYSGFASQESDSINHRMALESITLLKNLQNTLPLSKNQKILVAGYTANSLNRLNGAWSRTFMGENEAYNDPGKLTILEAVESKIGKANVLYAPGTLYDQEIDIEQAVSKARLADAIIVCVGEKPATEFFSDIDELELPAVQQQLVVRLAQTGKPVVLVMVQGRPRIIREIEPKVKAVAMAYLPGNEGGRAIADVLFGDFNPSGKLPYTYPKHSGGIMPYDLYGTFGLRGVEPQYAFGFGLSYTSFEYSNIQLSADSISNGDSVFVRIDLTNTGKRVGTEVAMLFLTDEFASVVVPKKQLKRFEKAELNPGETTTIGFTLTTKDLMFVNAANKWVVEPGYFTLQIGNQQARLYYYN